MMHSVFGQKKDLPYLDRPGAYLIPIRDGKVAVVRTPKGYFLLGGGLDGDEDHVTCIRRECLEETGHDASVGRCIGSAETYCVHAELGPFHPIQTYYAGDLLAQVQPPQESDHCLAWVPCEELRGRMCLPMQNWALEEALYPRKGRVILLCGKICSGKTHYAAELCQTHDLLTLSCDELMYELYRHEEGTDFDRLADRVKAYLHRKAIEAAHAGADVLLDWGFWGREERQRVTSLYRREGIDVVWHYLAISDAVWQRNIARRNAACQRDETTDYPVDEGLLQKLADRFEPPEPSEMDVWHKQEDTP